MITAVYPGSFDPLTNGHLDIIERSSKIFEKVIVAVLINPDKKYTFSVEDRVRMINTVTQRFSNVSVESFAGLTVHFLKEKDANIIIRGIRVSSDYDYEFQIAQMNKHLDDEIETLFMSASANNTYLSSSLVKQAATFNGNIKGLIPDEIHDEVIDKIKV